MTVAFVNTISKSGTHLTMMCLSLLPGFSGGLPCSGPYPYFSPEHSREDLRETLARSKAQDFFCGHIGFRSSLAKDLRELRVRTLLTIRDPRDVFVATLQWIEKFQGHSLHYPFAKLSREDQFRWLLLGSAKGSNLGVIFPSRASIYKSFLPWTRCDDVLVVRYEYLIGAASGGSDAAQEAEILRIANYLGLDMTSNRRKSVAEALRRASTAYDSDESNRLRGQIGLWRNIVPSKLTTRFNRALRPAMAEWGYV